MKKNIFIVIMLLPFINSITTHTISIVYNFRVAQITRQPIIPEKHHKYNTASWLLFDFFQKSSALSIQENYVGGLMTLNHDFAKKYYIKTDFAVAHANQTIQNVDQVDVIEPDDILFTMGRNFILNKYSRVTLSGLLGIPTHSVNTLQRVGFGVGQVGVGVQLDGLHKCNNYIDFLWGTRYNYFIPRTAFDAADNSYKFTVGSIADLLISLQTTTLLPHGLEGGYSARWGFGIDARPVIPEIESKNYMRNSFFLVYKYTKLTKRVAHRLLLNVAYGFDSKPKKIGYKAVIVWAAWGIAF